MNQSDDPTRPRPDPNTRTRWTRDGWDTFLRGHSKQLHKVIKWRAKLRPQDQDDVFADTLLGLAETLARRGPPDAPFSFVYGIAVNKTVSKVREVAAARRRGGATLPDSLEAPHRSPLAILEGREQGEAVRNYLAGLDPTDRAILVARGIDKLTWDEVSDRVGLPRTSVVRRFEIVANHARQQLADWAP